MHHETLLSIAQEIAKRVTEIVLQSTDLGVYTGSIGEGGDRVKYGDQLVENGLKAIIPFVLEKHGVQSGVVISEESGQWMVGTGAPSSGIFMIVDPIDGSRNMRPHATPRPFLGFSIAIGTVADLLNIGTFSAVRVGLIRDIFHKEEYYAVRGQGAFLNKIPLRSSPVTELNEVFLGASLDARGDRLQMILDQGLMDLILATKCQRRLGLSTLDLARVATGDYDAHVSLGGGVKIHDVAAAILIVEEAGGVVQLYHNGQKVNDVKWLYDLYRSNGESIKSSNFKMIAAGNEALLHKVQDVLHIK